MTLFIKEISLLLVFTVGISVSLHRMFLAHPVKADGAVTGRRSSSSSSSQQEYDEYSSSTHHHHYNHQDDDPFPLEPCSLDQVTAVYAFYGRPFGSTQTLLRSIQSLRQSKFPGTIRVVVDEPTYRSMEQQDENFLLLDKLVDTWQVESSLVLPDLTQKELIPHSNKIRAIQAGAFVNRTVIDLQECTIILDTDTYAHPQTPWTELLSTLQLNEVAVARDCAVPIDNVPQYLQHWMPNTGVLVLRNTPRIRRVLDDWLEAYRPCNATHVQSCTPGTDQYSFLQLLVKHAVRLEKLGHEWNCRCEGCYNDRDGNADKMEHPMYAMTILSRDQVLGGTSERTTCGGVRRCHILHGHFLKYFH